MRTRVSIIQCVIVKVPIEKLIHYRTTNVEYLLIWNV
jgi:hypothetical protein